MSYTQSMASEGRWSYIRTFYVGMLKSSGPPVAVGPPTQVRYDLFIDIVSVCHSEWPADSVHTASGETCPFPVCFYTIRFNIPSHERSHFCPQHSKWLFQTPQMTSSCLSPKTYKCITWPQTTSDKSHYGQPYPLGSPDLSKPFCHIWNFCILLKRGIPLQSFRLLPLLLQS